MVASLLLESDLEREVHISWPTLCNYRVAGRHVGSLGQLSESGAVNAIVETESREVCAVQNVVNLPAQLNIELFVNFRVLCKGKVPLAQSRPSQKIARTIPHGSVVGRHEAVRDVLVGFTRVNGDRVSGEAAADGASSETLPGGIAETILEHAEWMATKSRIDGAQLPSLPRPLAEVRNIRELVYATQIEVQMNILVAESVAILKIGMGQFRASYGIVIIDLRVVALATTIAGIEIKALAPSEVIRGIEAMPAPLVIRHLHAIVFGGALIGQGNEMPDKGIAGYGIGESIREGPQ